MRKPTEAQRAAAKERRERIKTLARKLAKMSESERIALVGDGVATIEGRALSLHNTCLVVSQMPGATVVGGFQQWRKAGRQVRKGEHGAAIWIPLGKADPADGATMSINEEHKSDGARFILGTVFDVSQTEPIGMESEALAA